MVDKIRRLRFTDAHRVLLMLILGNYAHLLWDEAAAVFNTIFDHETRTRHTLEQAWWHRNNDQLEEWELAWNEPRSGHELELRDQWLQAILDAMKKLNISTTTKTSRNPSKWTKWNYDMRLVSHLLQQDGSLNPSKRTRIINVIFREHLSSVQSSDVTEPSLQGQMRLRREQARAVAGGGDVKWKNSELKPAQQWQRILKRPTSEDDRAERAKWEEEIIKQKSTLRSTADQGSLKKSQVDEEEVDAGQEVGEEIRQHKPQENQGEPSINPNEDVGDWRFGTWYDWHQAKTNLGGQMTGMPVEPTAKDVRRLRRELSRTRRHDVWTQGINIYPGSETVNWADMTPDPLSRTQQGRQGESSSEPTRPKDPGNRVPATALGENGGDMSNSGCEAATEEAAQENNIQESGPEDDPEAKKGSRVNLSSLHRCLLPQAKINNHLLRSGSEDAAVVRQDFERLNRNTLVIIVLAARFVRFREDLRKRKSR